MDARSRMSAPPSNSMSTACRSPRSRSPQSRLAARLQGPVKFVLRAWTRARRHVPTLVGMVLRIRSPRDLGRFIATVARAVGVAPQECGLGVEAGVVGLEAGLVGFEAGLVADAPAGAGDWSGHSGSSGGKHANG